MLKPLRQAINDVVVEHVTSKLRTGEPVDVAFMAREMSLPLIDMVMEQDEKHQGPLLAQIIGSLATSILNGADFFKPDDVTTNEENGASLRRRFEVSRRPPGFQKLPEGPTAPYDRSGRCVPPAQTRVSFARELLTPSRGKPCPPSTTTHLLNCSYQSP